MARRVSPLTSLESASLIVTPASRSGVYTVGSSFNLPLLIFNAGRQPVAWSPQNPLHMSYRWFNKAGEAVERDGVRTSILAPPAPKSEIPITLIGRTPEEPGKYRLQASLVLEGVHWACDVDERGWTELQVDVIPRPAWPRELRGSTGGRALRGALARAALARSLDGNASEVTIEPAAHGSVDPFGAGQKPAPAADSSHVSYGSKLRNWVRRTIGIRNVQQDLDRVANAVTRQEQRSTETHHYLQRIEIMLSQGLNGIQADLEKLAGTLRKDQIFNKLTALEVNRSLTTMRDDQLAQAQSQSSVAGQGRLASSIDTPRTPQHALNRETKSGKVVSELISALRNLAECVEANEESQLFLDVRKGLGQLLQEVHSDAERLGRNDPVLPVRAGRDSHKLDALLTRQPFPLAAAGLVLLRGEFGFLAIQDDDAAAIADYRSGELPEAGTVALIDRLLAPGDCFLDVGAKVGIYSLLAGRKVGGTGKVVAVEPTPSVMSALRVTLAINGLSDSVDAHRCALGSQADVPRLTRGKTSGRGSSIGSNARGSKSLAFMIKTGDELLAGARPKLIKIDVRGRELDVLSGLRQTIEASEELSIILKCSPDRIRRMDGGTTDWIERIRSFDFKCWRVEDDAEALSPIDDLDEIDDRGANLLLSRSLDSSLGSMLK